MPSEGANPAQAVCLLQSDVLVLASWCVADLPASTGSALCMAAPGGAHGCLHQVWPARVLGPLRWLPSSTLLQRRMP